MSLIKIKRMLSKNFFGRFLLKVYHYLIAVPLSFLRLFFSKFKKVKKIDVSFFTYDETFDMLIKEHKSLSRFGDGEISWMFGKSKGYFGQENSAELSARLKNTILSENANMLIGVPDFFGEMNNYSSQRKKNRTIHLSKFYNEWKQVLKSDKKYVDALITRVYNGRENIDYLEIFNSWRNVWENRNVVVVEGKQTRFGVGNDLLDNSRSVRRVICPSENAFSRYKDILNSCLKLENVDLFLLALGPTASILALDLCEKGEQAIDIGHLDIEYEWFLAGARTKQPVVGKYVNEAGGASLSELPEEILNVYKKEIVDIID